MKKIFILLLSLILSLLLVVSASAEAFTPIYGIDVSYWQGDINWGMVANTDNEFAIIRIGYNDKQDAQFLNNYNKAKDAGIPVGAYMYSYAVTEEAAIEEANIVLERIKGMQFEYPIYLDVEDPKLLKEEYNLTKEQRTKNALAFVRTMQENGYYVGVYANLYWFTNYLDVEAIQSECETWIAHYNESYDYSNTAYGMWQYSQSGIVDGISGDVDLNICYKDYPSIIKNGGYNGFEKPSDGLLEPTGVKYDIDANGVCNLQDLVVLAQYVAEWKGLEYVESELNVNGDAEGIVDLTDVVLLSQIIAGW
ncbi:MAG: hypothetical protein E7551_02840 [Ruminococcaceae bacterium]|nr:hypothetical protein [Oscillospiraceae bacterium]